MADVNQGAGNFHRARYFPSIRTIMLVRLDPGTSEAQTNVRREDKPDPNLARKLDSLGRAFGFGAGDVSLKVGPGGASLVPPPDTLGRALGFDGDDLALVRGARGGFSLASSDPRAAAFAANANLADAISRVALEDEYSRFLDVTPVSSQRSVNSHRQADELTVKLAWKDFPFDARIIRAVLMLHFEGTVTASSFAAGTTRGGRGAVTERADQHLVPATGENLRFVGLADAIDDDHDDGGDDVTIKGRDLTAPLIDEKMPAALLRKIRPGTTILEAIRVLLDSLKGTAAEFIRGPYVRPASLQLPSLDRSRYPKLATSAKSRNEAGRAGGDPSVQRKPSRGAEGGGESYWDAITDLCVSHGLVPLIEKDQLILQPPRTLFVGTRTSVTTGEASFPGEHRRDIGDTAHTERRMVYGHNLDTLKFGRKLARVKAPAVKVVAYNPDAPDARKRLIEVLHPPNALATRVSPTGGGKTVEIHTVLVHGITDLELLRATAEAAYESMGRSELGITWSTSDLASFSDHPRFDPNLEPDLLDLRAGDAVRLLVTPTDRRTGQLFSITELSALIARARGLAGGGDPEYSDAVSFLRRRGWKDADAQQLVRVLSSAAIPDEFRVAAASISFDMAAGSVSIQVDARNYIRVRADPDDATQHPGGPGTPVSGGVVA